MSGVPVQADGQILTVCTGNICRSTYLERRLRQELAAAWGSALPVGAVVSAGTRGLVGAPIDPPVQEMLRARGADAGGHAGRRLDKSHVAAADLVLTATREHRAAVVKANPKALKYAFTVKDFAQIAAAIPDDELPRETTWPAQLRAAVALVASRRGRVPPLDELAADVADPYGQAADAYAVMRDDVEAALASLMSVLACENSGD